MILFIIVLISVVLKIFYSYIFFKNQQLIQRHSTSHQIFLVLPCKTQLNIATKTWKNKTGAIFYNAILNKYNNCVNRILGCFIEEILALLSKHIEYHNCLSSTFYPSIFLLLVGGDFFIMSSFSYPFCFSCFPFPKVSLSSLHDYLCI